jgi:hypothetical protein
MDIAELNGVELAPELHLDCDWTPSTRASFFGFVQDLKNRLAEGWELAVTLRLDQYKNYWNHQRRWFLGENDRGLGHRTAAAVQGYLEETKIQPLNRQLFQAFS